MAPGVAPGVADTPVRLRYLVRITQPNEPLQDLDYWEGLLTGAVDRKAEIWPLRDSLSTLAATFYSSGGAPSCIARGRPISRRMRVRVFHLTHGLNGPCPCRPSTRITSLFIVDYSEEFSRSASHPSTLPRPSRWPKAAAKPSPSLWRSSEEPALHCGVVRLPPSGPGRGDIPSLDQL